MRSARSAPARRRSPWLLRWGCALVAAGLVLEFAAFGVEPIVDRIVRRTVAAEQLREVRDAARARALASAATLYRVDARWNDYNAEIQRVQTALDEAGAHVFAFLFDYRHAIAAQRHDRGLSDALATVPGSWLANPEFRAARAGFLAASRDANADIDRLLPLLDSILARPSTLAATSDRLSDEIVALVHAQSRISLRWLSLRRAIQRCDDRAISDVDASSSGG